jgi:SAM-dependent methyltransferase
MSTKSLKLHYTNNSSILCEIGKKYDTDKSSQRSNVSNERHCHPYTLFYESLFRNYRSSPLKIAELGILQGASLRMWQEYFQNATLYGFDFDTNLLEGFKNSYNNDRIVVSHINVHNKESIQNAFNATNTLFDIIIEDTTHQFEDQIRVIEVAYQYLKPGGILIIEDIYKSYNEANYIERLTTVLHHFQDYYFIELDHFNRNSTGWDNDKLFVLVKGGAVPIFKNQNKITIITPSYRPTNLLQIKESIDFNCVDEWLIIYDGSKITENPNLFQNQENNKIKEHVYTGEGISGNPQRNYALNLIENKDTILYYLDDDNIMHPDIYSLLNIIDNTKMYTFNQVDRLLGNNISLGAIDTAMILIPYKLCENERWILHEYGADGHYILACYNPNSHIFVNNFLCYYNKIGFFSIPT